MKQIFTAGRILYAMGIVSMGIHLLLLKDFRPEVVPAFPAWAHHFIILPLLTGIVFIITGIMIAGFNAKNASLYLGYFFLALIITCHLPYMLFFSNGNASSLAGWFAICQAMACCGGAFVIAGIGAGRILFAVLMIVFGCSHFVYASNVSGMVPAWAGAPMFWTYFVGVALVAAGVGFVLKIWIKPAGLLLAFMLFCFFIFFHVPDAINNPEKGHGNEIVRAVIALMYAGISLATAATDGNKNITSKAG